MKNKVVKKLGAAVLTSVMIMGITACGSEGGGQDVTENATDSIQEGQATDTEATASVQSEVEKPAQISWWAASEVYEGHIVVFFLGRNDFQPV